MPDFQHRLAASRDAARRLAAVRVSEVTPSRRDFAQYVATQRSELAVIAEILPEAVPSHRSALIEYARACDDADVAALAVRTEPGGLDAADMAAIAAAVSAPILHDALTIDPNQLYHARLHGADAAVFPAGALDAVALRTLADIASSLHMAAVVEVASPEDVARALGLPHVLIGLRCEQADGRFAPDGLRSVLRQIPAGRTTVALSPVASLVQCTALRGRCDAVLAGDLLRNATDLAACVRQIASGDD